MSNELQAGRILIREDTPLPTTLRIESEPYVFGWRLVKDLDECRFGRKVRETGWTFFCLAGRVRAAGFGSERQNGVRSAVRRMLTRLTSEKFNSLEITGVVSKRFLGLPYVIVSARSRHIQNGVFLLGASDVQEWNRTDLAAA